jgi:hypothetical protein
MCLPGWSLAFCMPVHTVHSPHSLIFVFCFLLLAPRSPVTRFTFASRTQNGHYWSLAPSHHFSQPQFLPHPPAATRRLFRIPTMMLFRYFIHASITSLFFLHAVASPAFEEAADMKVTELVNPRDLKMMGMMGMQPMVMSAKSPTSKPAAKPTMTPTKPPTNKPIAQDVCAGFDLCGVATFKNCGVVGQDCFCNVDTENTNRCVGRYDCNSPACTTSSDCLASQKCFRGPHCCGGAGRCAALC